MKLLESADMVYYLKERHVGVVRGLRPKPRLAIIRSADNVAAEKYLRAKTRYGADIGVGVDTYAEGPATLLGRIASLNADPAVTGIVIQLPVPAELVAEAVAAVHPAKDVDGLAPNSHFEAGTPKAVLWLLAGYNIELKGRIVVVGQGRLVGKPLADRLQAAGLDVHRADEHTKDLPGLTRTADILFTGTGQEHLISADMVKEGAVVVDTGSPRPELHPDVYKRDDVIITPNPGGVGPMTVVSLFDNLLIAAQTKRQA